MSFQQRNMNNIITNYTNRKWENKNNFKKCFSPTASNHKCSFSSHCTVNIMWDMPGFHFNRVANQSCLLTTVMNFMIEVMTYHMWVNKFTWIQIILLKLERSYLLQFLQQPIDVRKDNWSFYSPHSNPLIFFFSGVNPLCRACLISMQVTSRCTVASSPPTVL